jgi:cellulose synthase/poly-beta-1,6-N-acetylglucosamine synthase-like glycosyltransferase|tara:strand:+ start:2207 stop:3202 length:996 start_codon:yes stop_codon:yes gene_type:complete
MSTFNVSPHITIIIPFSGENAYINECLDQCVKLDYPHYDIIVVTSAPVTVKHPKIKYVECQEMSPAEKRDLAIKSTKAEICAFLDSDCFPQKDWLRHAIKYFSDPKIGGVGGPGLSPEQDTVLQKAGGVVYKSLLLSSYRYMQKKSRFVDDYPSFNLIIRSSVLQEIGGFGSTYKVGEDTKLCLEVIRIGKRIIYASDVIVFHHRRPLFLPHLRQVWGYGKHRGHFVRNYPETSRRLEYFLPSILLFMFLAMGLLAIQYNLFIHILGLTLLGHLVAGLILGFLSTRQINIALLTSFAIPLTLWMYGIAFIEGLLVDPRKRYHETGKMLFGV